MRRCRRLRPSRAGAFTHTASRMMSPSQSQSTPPPPEARHQTHSQRLDCAGVHVLGCHPQFPGVVAVRGGGPGREEQREGHGEEGGGAAQHRLVLPGLLAWLLGFCVCVWGGGGAWSVLSGCEHVAVLSMNGCGAPRRLYYFCPVLDASGGASKAQVAARPGYRAEMPASQDKKAPSRPKP